MSKPTIADSGWADLTLDHLRAALKAAENTASDMAALQICDAADCGHIFDGRDKRSCTITEGKTTYHFCPACEMEAQAAAVDRGRG